MNTPKSEVVYKVALLQKPNDGQPKVRTFTIDSLVGAVRQAPLSATPFDAYHFQKSELKRLTTESRAARDAGDVERAKDLKTQAALFGHAVDRTKFGPAVMPFIFKDDVTFKQGPHGWPQRDNSGITHFSLLMLDVESNTTQGELHNVLKEYEYVLWPTITHKPDDPRYRIVLFPAEPLPIPEAQALIYRIDARLPPRNDLSKKLQNLDSSCTDVGRLMFLPKWLVNHPEPYAIVHNVGELVTPASFSVTPEIQAAINERISAAEDYRTQRTAENIALVRSAPAVVPTPYVVTVNGKDWLNPDAYFETKAGFVRLADVTTKISGVSCPFHADAIGSEFIAPNIHTGRPQLVCAKCHITMQMAPTRFGHSHDGHDAETNSAAFATLVNKARSKKATIVRPTVSASTKPLIEFDAAPKIDAQPKVHYFSEQYLPDIRSVVPERGLLFVRSPKGTGKTEALYQLIQTARTANQSVILLTHRRSLAKNLAGRLQIANYQDLENGTLSSFMVLCVNSITSRVKDTAAAHYDTVIVDESEQVLRNLLSSTLKNNLSDIFNKILILMRNARRVVCLDADLSSDLTLEVMALLRDPTGEREEDEFVGIINDFQIGKGKTIRSLPNRYQLLAEICQSAEAGKKIFVACSTARASTVIGEILKAQGKNVLVINSNTSEHPEVVAFQNAPNYILGVEPVRSSVDPETLITFDEAPAPRVPALPKISMPARVHYDAVVASPSLQTGFSIDEQYFDKVFGWFQGVEGITYQDYDQALSRVRHCDDVTVWVEATKRPPKIDPPQLFIQHAIFREMATRKKLPGETIRLTEGERLWVRVEGLLNYLTALWSHQRDSKFRAMKAELGFTIEMIDLNEAGVEAGKLLWGEFKDVGPDYPALIFHAMELDDEEFLALQRRNHKTNDDHLALKRYRIAAAIDQELTLDLVAQAIEEDLLRVVARTRSLVIDDDGTRANRDIQDRVRHHTAFTQAGHRTIEHELLVKHLCGAANIDIKDYHARVAAGETIGIPVSLMDRVVDAFVERSQDFKHFYKLRIETVDRAVARAKEMTQVAGEHWTAEAEAEAIEKAKQRRRKRVWNGTFGSVGLPVTKRKRGRRENQVACYFIEPESVELTTEAIQKEQRVHQAISPLLERVRAKVH